MNLRLFLLLALLCVPRVLAQALPELGDVSGAAISPADERKLGERIMREIRRDPAYLDDAEVSEYANSLGSRLTARSQVSAKRPTNSRRNLRVIILRSSSR